MSDLFGAPSGIIAAQEQDRAQTLAGIGAVKSLGEIAMQPVEMQYKSALSRLHTAEASQKEAEAAAQQQLLDLQTDFAKNEVAARQQLIAGAASQGIEATVDHLQGGSAQAALQPHSAAERLEKLAAFGEQKGVPPLALAKVYNEISQIREREGQTAWRQQEAAKSVYEMGRETRIRVGGLAATAASSPQAYATIMMSPERKSLPAELTGDYGTDVTALRTIAQSSLTAEQQAQNERAKTEANSRDALRKARIASAAAGAAVATERVKVLKTAHELAEKYGGPAAEATIRLKNTRSEAQINAVVAAQNKAAPPISLDPLQNRIGDTRTLPDGRIVSIVGREPNGKPIMRLQSTERADALRKAVSAATVPAEPETADETGD